MQGVDGRTVDRTDFMAMADSIPCTFHTPTDSDAWCEDKVLVAQTASFMKSGKQGRPRASENVENVEKRRHRIGLALVPPATEAALKQKMRLLRGRYQEVLRKLTPEGASTLTSQWPKNTSDLEVL